MNFLGLFLHLLIYIIAIIVPLGYGVLFHNIFFNKNNSIFGDVGSLGFLGFYFLFFISLSFHFFIPLNDVFCLAILAIGLLAFVYNSKFIKSIFSKYYIAILLILYPLSIIFYPNEDFNHYYLPYLTFIETSKIAFGLVNLNDGLAFTQNSLYDMYVFFKIPSIIENSYSIPGISFYFFFACFLISQFKKFSDKNGIFLLLIIVLSFSTFTKLRDIGAVIPSQFLMIASLISFYFAFKFKDQKDYLVLALFYALFAFFLRINAIVILPIIALSLIVNFKHFPKLIGNHKLFFSFSILITILFFLKNIIISGCLIYPVHSTCFDKTFNWSASNEKTITKLASFQSFSKGWMFYARDKLKISDKYVWKNYESNDFKKVEEYSKSNLLFWSKYWLKDHDYKKIINVFAIGLFYIIFVLLWNYKRIENIFKKNIMNKFTNSFSKKEFVFTMFCFFNLLLWLVISPQSRYGGYAVSIIFVSLVFSQILATTVNLKDINKIPIFILIVFSIIYLDMKNFNRIQKDFFMKKENAVFFPWPNYIKTDENIDYKKEYIDNIGVNFRLKTNKLYNGDIDSSQNYFLLCGNISFPCTPVRTKSCIKNIDVKKGYLFIYHNFENEKCKKLFANNMVF